LQLWCIKFKGVEKEDSGLDSARAKGAIHIYEAKNLKI
jgi:hypothetical protein